MDPHTATSVQYHPQAGVLENTVPLPTAVVWFFALLCWEVLMGNLAEVQRLFLSQSYDRRPMSDATEEGKSDPPQVAAFQLAWT